MQSVIKYEAGTDGTLGLCQLINPENSRRTMSLIDANGDVWACLAPGSWIRTSNKYTWIESPIRQSAVRRFVSWLKALVTKGGK